MSLKNVTKNVRLNEHEGESLPPGLNPQAVFDTPPSPRGSAPKTPNKPHGFRIPTESQIANAIPLNGMRIWQKQIS